MPRGHRDGGGLARAIDAPCAWCGAGIDRTRCRGSCAPRREFLHVDDFADALVFLLKRYSDDSHVNVGTARDITIRELAELLAKVAG